MSHFRIVWGIAIWIGLASWAWIAVGEQFVGDREDAPPVIDELWQYATGSPSRVDLQFADTWEISIGDPIFQETSPGEFERVGEVTRVGVEGDTRRAAEVNSAAALFYSGKSAPGRIDHLEYYTTPDSLAWVLTTMLPPSKRREIAGEVNAAVQEHQQVIIDELRPIVRSSFREAIPVLEKEIVAALHKNHAELARISSRYQKDVIDSEIIPLVKREVWPVVIESAEPLANEIGIALWKRVSVWRFTWRYFSDLAPLTRNDRFEKEWNRFLEKEAVPVIEERTDDLIAVVKEVLSETARNPQVQAAFRRNLMKALDDEELQQAVWRIVRDAMLKSSRLREVFDKQWRSPETRRAFSIASARLEPTAQRVGQILFGSPEGGITPQFQAVLRNRILHKDQRWLVVRVRSPQDSDSVSNSETLPVQRGNAADYSPFVDR